MADRVYGWAITMADKGRWYPPSCVGGYRNPGRLPRRGSETFLTRLLYGPVQIAYTVSV
jgi:hypothetical protein